MHKNPRRASSRSLEAITAFGERNKDMAEIQISYELANAQQPLSRRHFFDLGKACSLLDAVCDANQQPTAEPYLLLAKYFFPISF